MATCGEYELDRAIGWGRRSTFFSARTTGGTGPAVIVIRRARSVERSLSHAFLRAAAEQQTAVGAGCRRLAPILTFDRDETGFAYYATTRYETSLAEFLEAGCRVDSTLLREIVTGTLSALTELHDKSRRAHGNLTPGNILLDPQGRVFLTDLAPSSKDATVADDLFALGTLIYQLVRHTTRIGMLNPPLDYSPEWTESLGDESEGWREFTNRVLTKSRNKGPEALKAAAADLKSLGSLAAKVTVAPPSIAPDGTQRAARRTPPKKKSRLPALIVLILLIGGGVGGYIGWKNHVAAENDRKEKDRIAAEIDAAQKARPQAIKDLQENLSRPLPTEFDDDKPLQSLLGRIAKSLSGTGTKNDVMSLLGNWEIPEKLTKRATEWRKEPREWKRLADELDAAAQIDPEKNASIIEQLKGAIAKHSASNELEVLWGDVELSLKDLKATNIPQIPDFTPWALNEVLNAKNLADASVRAKKALEELRTVVTFEKEMGKRVAWTRLEKEAPGVLRVPPTESMQTWVTDWRQKAGDFVGPTAEKRAAWEKVFARAETRIPKRTAAEQVKWRKLLADERAATADALERDVDGIDTRLLAFKGLTTPEEDDYEKYAPFLKQWKITASQVQDKNAGTAAMNAFKKGTEDLKITGRYPTAGFVDAMKLAIQTPDKISLSFSKPEDWELIASDPGAAIYKYRGTIAVPFLALGKSGYAMSAIEMPLSIAKLAGAGGTPPGAGPRIRGNDFSPDATDQWLWKGPMDFIRSVGLQSYFAGVSPGDIGSEQCPVTWISFSEAKAIAEKLGGQLPTAAQYSLAMARAGATRRLRASAWTAQVNQVLQWNKTYNVATRSFLPDTGSFSKQVGLSANIGYFNDANAAAGATDDRTLWLKSVFPQGGWKPGDQFYNLIGNAAEWVDDNGIPSVMGGSVVSPPSLPTNAALPVRTGAGAFDVTFRLVVKTGEGGAGDWLIKFQEVVGKIPAPPEPAKQ